MGRQSLKPRPRNLNASIYYRKTNSGGSYHLYYKDPETLRQRSVKVATGAEKDPLVIAEANKTAAEFLKQLDDKKKISLPSDITVSEAWEQFKKRKKLKPSTLDDYTSIWNVYLEPRFGKLRVRDLDRDRIDAFCEWVDAKVVDDPKKRNRKQGQISNKRRNNILIALKSFLTFLNDEEYTPENLGKKMTKPDQFVRKARPIPTYEQTSQILRTIDPHYRALVETALYTGARGGELVALDWASVDFNDNLIFFNASFTHGKMNDSTKSGDTRTVPMPNRLVSTLQDWKQKSKSDTIVFPNKIGNRLSLDDFRKRYWKPTVEAVGLPGLRIHDMRHTYITWLVESSQASALTISQVAGHKSPKTTAWYIQNRSKEFDRVRQPLNTSKEDLELKRLGFTDEMFSEPPKKQTPKKKQPVQSKGIRIKK